MKGVEIDFKRIIHDTTILFVICVISGLLLGLAREVTYPITTARKAEEKAQTYRAILVDADHFEDSADLIGTAQAALTSAGISATIKDMMTAYDASGNVMGYAYSVVTAGKIAEITTAVGVTAEGEVLGIEILESSETSGLGSKAKDPAFKDQFANKTVSSFTVVKGDASADNQISAISGATVTSNSVATAVNAAIVVTSSMAQ